MRIWEHEHAATAEELREAVEAIRSAVSREELVALILELCNIPSMPGYEKAAGDYVHDWMEKENFSPRRVGMVPDRFNVIGRHGGQRPGAGRNLLLTSHLDTESPQYNWRDRWKYRPGSTDRPEWLQARLQDGIFTGRPVENDRGPMACTMIAAKALKAAGLPMAGLLYITACPGEIGPEQVEEFQGAIYLGKELGAQYMLTHGGVAPDFAIAAEGTDFGITWMSCGHVNFRIDLYGEDVFTPLLEHPESLKQHPSPLVTIAPFIGQLQQWAANYEKQYEYRTSGGTAVPKVQIGAIRGGDPHLLGGGSEVCSIYVEVNVTPQGRVAPVQRQLEQLLLDGGYEGHVEPIVYRQGFEADAGEAGALHRCISQASAALGKGETPIAHSVYSSMWRDHNVFNMFRIPGVTYGPRRFRPSVDDMVDAAVIYAAAAWQICNSRAPEAVTNL